MAGGFNQNTRRRNAPAISLTRPALGGFTSHFEISPVGLISRLWISVRGTLSSLGGGTLAGRGLLGQCAWIKNIRIYANNGPDVFNISGEGYHYLLRPCMDAFGDVHPQSNARNGITTTAVNLDMVVPLSQNLRDALGIWLVQTQQVLLSGDITWAPDSDIMTGTTGSVFGAANSTPLVANIYPEWFTLPKDPADMPNTTSIHRIIEEQETIPSLGASYEKKWLKGNIYQRMLHGITNKTNAGFLASGSTDPLTTALNAIQLRVNQADYLHAHGTDFLDMVTPFFRAGAAPATYPATNGTSNTRIVGTYPFDFMGSSGYGSYGVQRDPIDTSEITDISTLFATSGSGAATLYSVREEVII